MTATVLPPASFGVSGNTSSQMLDRIAQWDTDDTPEVGSAVPDVGVIFGFPNDPANSLPQATTQLNAQCILLAAKHAAYGEPQLAGGAYVAGQANLPSTGRQGQRYVVQADTSTTGGVAALDASQATTVTGSVTGSGPAVWECRTPGLAAEYGWGRIAVSSTAPTACKRLVVVSTNYKNFSVDGSGNTDVLSPGRRDTLGTPEPFYAAVRAAQQAAVAAENVVVNGKPSVVYADLYGLQRTMIVGGTFPASGSPALSRTFAAGFVPDFSGGAAYDATRTWHHQASNQHHNRFGHWCVAYVTHLAIVNAGWATDLKALPAAVNIKCLGDSQTDYRAGYVQALFTWPVRLGRLLAGYLSTLP